MTLPRTEGIRGGIHLATHGGMEMVVVHQQIKVAISTTPQSSAVGKLQLLSGVRKILKMVTQIADCPGMMNFFSGIR